MRELVLISGVSCHSLLVVERPLNLVSLPREHVTLLKVELGSVTRFVIGYVHLAMMLHPELANDNIVDRAVDVFPSVRLAVFRKLDSDQSCNM